MVNPFEDEDGQYLALINDEAQYSLWPAEIDVPDGWQVVFGPTGRRACLDEIGRVWTDMRPAGLVAGRER